MSLIFALQFIWVCKMNSMAFVHEEKGVIRSETAMVTVIQNLQHCMDELSYAIKHNGKEKEKIS